MPTVLRVGKYRFFFFSGEGNEPAHIHVDSGDDYAKFWLDPVQAVRSVGYSANELNRLRKIVVKNGNYSRTNGMNTLVTKKSIPMASEVWFDTDKLYVRLLDGREISAPLEWFPRLRDATNAQRKKWRLIGRGIGIHWPDIDEDVSVESLLK